MTKVIKVSVLADLTCPWCYIGGKEIDAALERLKLPSTSPVKFEIEHRPFLLNPGLKEDEIQPKKEYIGAKLGKVRWEQMCTVMAERCKQLGLPGFSDGVIFPTIRAHRLLLYTWNKCGADVQHKLLYDLYEGTLYRAENLHDVEKLATYAEKAGVMSKDEAIKFLKSDELQAEIIRIMSCAQRNGITGVPFTIIDGRWAISGGQTADVYYEIFQKLAKGTDP